MSSKAPKQKIRSSKATKLSQKLVVHVQAGEKSPVRTDTPPPTYTSHHSRTRSGKIRAMTEPEPDKDYQEAGTDFPTFTRLHQLVYKTTQNGRNNLMLIRTSSIRSGLQLGEMPSRQLQHTKWLKINYILNQSQAIKNISCNALQ